MDSHEVVYGVPSNSALSTAASAASAASGVPVHTTIPELSFGKRDERVGAAKIGVFAYDRETREGIWQSGPSVARATAKDIWVLGVGPFQRGTIYRGKLRFAGETLDTPAPGAREGVNGPIANYNEEALFRSPGNRERTMLSKDREKDRSSGKKQAVKPIKDSAVQQASGESVQVDEPKAGEE
jgi:hypothetical protein